MPQHRSFLPNVPRKSLFSHRLKKPLSYTSSTSITGGFYCLVDVVCVPKNNVLPPFKKNRPISSFSSVASPFFRVTTPLLLPFWQPPWCVAWWPPHPPAPTPARFAHPPGIAWWVPAGFRCRPRPAPAVVRSRWWGCCACTPRRPGWRWGSWAIDVLGKISKNLEILGKCVNK